MALAIRKYVEGEPTRRTSTTLLGPSGSGKTHQARSLIVKGAEVGERVLYVNTEQKCGTLSDLWERGLFDEFPVNKLDFPLSGAEKQELLRAGESDMMALIDYLRHEEHPYTYCFLDSYMFLVMRRFWLLAFEKFPTSSKGEKDTRAAYGLLGNKTRMEMDLLKQCTHPSTAKRPVHVVVTWGVEQGQDWEGRRKVVPIADGQMIGPVVPFNFDNVFYLLAKEESEGKIKRLMYTARTHEFDAKVSAGGVTLPPIIDLTSGDVTLWDVLKKLTGGVVATQGGSDGK